MLISSGGLAANYFYIDEWHSMPHSKNMEFCADEKIIYVCRQEGQWSVLRTSVCELITQEEILRRTVSESDTIEALHKELHPSELDTGTHDVLDMKADPKTGMYL